MLFFAEDVRHSFNLFYEHLQKTTIGFAFFKTFDSRYANKKTFWSIIDKLAPTGNIVVHSSFDKAADIYDAASKKNIYLRSLSFMSCKALYPGVFIHASKVFQYPPDEVIELDCFERIPQYLVIRFSKMNDNILIVDNKDMYNKASKLCRNCFCFVEKE